MPGSRPRGRWLRSSARPDLPHEAGDAALRAEFVRIAGESDSALFHDTLAEPNEPVWFHAFVEHARLHGLTYVAEALPSMMAGGGLAPRVREFLASSDRLAREQYLDFARVRRFRQSLLCRSEVGRRFPVVARAAHRTVRVRIAAIASRRRGGTTAGGARRPRARSCVDCSRR